MHTDVRSRQRPEVAVGEEQPLAPEGVRRGEPAPQVGVGDRRPQVCPAGVLQESHEPGVPEAETEGLHAGVLGPPEQPLCGGEGPQQPPPQTGHPVVGLGQHPLGGALEQVETCHVGDELRHELDGRGAGAHDGDPAAGEVGGMVPLRGVEDGAGEGIEAGHLGQLRLVPGARGGHQETCGERAAGGLDAPAVALPPAVGHLRGEPGHPLEAVTGRDVAQVAEDLRLPGEGPRPAGVGGEGERVQRRGHVAGTARVGVRPPRTAEGVGLLQDQQVGDAGFPEPDRGADAGRAAADDDDLMVGRGAGGGGHLGSSGDWNTNGIWIPTVLSSP